MDIEVRIQSTMNREGEYRLDDTVWLSHLPHEVGFCRRMPGGAFVGVFYHLNQAELDAVRYGLDLRDEKLFPETKQKSWPERQIVNAPRPEAFRDAVAKVNAAKINQQIENGGPSIYVPDEY